MGGGNAQKSATARERKLKEQAKANKGSQLSANAAAMTKKCNVCLQTFVSTTTDVVLKQHWENKHPKLPIENCFPQFKA